ncbi:endonuclease III [Candidatus Kinetoplastibacterium desouzaii TCC079E]|uniref:Endonuclease III n=1 Tax=Candidatus Kinetoplastidibacterium desouzai TCC079E TaxID=1208919 RepID=M1L2P7_9PROT|nr:endonuclease III [Candidatus Kinetoplastibacterium desouzaii]AGF47028.1 endonuclease III [Candidatus Kinetoplastibacterium desouzaii TCC079E]
MDHVTISNIFERLKKSTPQPKTELKYNSSFELLIAVILSAQATDKSVNLATKELFKTYKTPDSFIKLGLVGIEEHIKSIGLYRTKAKNILKTCQIIEEQFSGEIPNNRLNLESLPGVGRKTSNVILNIIFNQPTIAVDTHVFRVSNRTGIATGNNVIEVEKKLLKNIPKKYLNNAHHWLIFLGRYTCKKRKPDCKNCLINDLCDSYKKDKII